MRDLARRCAAWAAIAALSPGLAAAQPAAPPEPPPQGPSPLVIAQPDPAGPVAAVFRDPAAAPAPTPERVAALLRQHVRYVFVLFQENRSFDSYFGSFPGADGLFSDGQRPRAPADTPGFTQRLLDTDGSPTTVQPFLIGQAEHAADADDVDHGHVRMAAKMDLVDGRPRMDRFAEVEERKYVPAGTDRPSLQAKQMGELTMAYEDCDTVPFLWNYASRFTLFDHVFQTTIGPSTPNAIAMISGQVGETQWVKHPEQAGAGGSTTVPILNDPIAYWGSESDRTAGPQRQPANTLRERSGVAGANTAPNLTFSSLPLTLAGREVTGQVAHDADPARDLADIQADLPAIAAQGGDPFPWGWYEEGYDREPNEPQDAPAGGSHASYIGHHNGAQYFGYISNNPEMTAHEHGLGDFFADVAAGRLPASGVFWVRGGYTSIDGRGPAWNDGSPEAQAVQRNFRGDDDHPAYSDSELSEALVAREVNAIARSPYWGQSAIIITYDESEGDYDHVPPRILSYDPAKLPLSRGPRMPLILISPYARAHAVSREEGDHNSVIKLIDLLYDLPPLADLPDELQARLAGEDPRFNGPDGFRQTELGPHDDRTPGTGDLLSGFDPARLSGEAPPLAPEYAELPDAVVDALPHYGGQGCRALGITTEDRRQHRPNPVPADFNPRPLTSPTR